MPILYIITGPAGVGKSTISKELAMSSNKSVLIEGDNIYHQVIGGYTPAWKDGNHLQTFWKVCMNIFQIYLDDGYDVIFNYIVTPPLFYHTFLLAFPLYEDLVYYNHALTFFLHTLLHLI